MLRWDEHPFALKHMADRHFALGVTHLVFHTYTHNPRLDVAPGTSFGAFIGTPFLRGQTWWKSMPLFTAYLARCGFMLEQGNPVADVLWYLGDELDHKPRQDSPFPDGYRFDYVNYDALAHQIDVQGRLLRNSSGITWQVLWLPPQTCGRLTPQTLQRLIELVEKGATVLAAPPMANATLAGGVENQAFAEMVRRLWGEHPAEKGDRTIGGGRLLWGLELKEALELLAIGPDFVSAGGLECCHRRSENADIYFIAAGRDAPLTGNVGFRCQGPVAFWDPLAGMNEPVTLLSRQGEYTYVSLNLPAGGSTFVVFDRAGSSDTRWFSKIEFDGQTIVDAGDRTRLASGRPGRVQGLTGGQENQPWVDYPLVQYDIVAGGRQLLGRLDGHYQLTTGDGQVVEVNIAGARQRTLDGPWRLTFPAGWVAEENQHITLAKLIPWSKLDDPESRAFSGTAAYECTVDVAAIDPDERVMLDLGKVCHIASVSVNGKAVAEKWAAPFRFDISGFLVKGVNTITVQVTNTWYNRLIYDASLPEEQRKTWTIHAPGPQTPMQEAGLVGPVMLHWGKLVDLNGE